MSTTLAPQKPAHDPLLETILDEERPLRLDGRAAGLAEVARRVARASPPCDRSARRGLLARVRANHHDLVATYRDLSSAAATGEQPGPEAEWLLDNFYVIDEVFREVLTDLPQQYHDELPSVESAPLAGLPRTYALAVGLLVHADSSLGESALLEYARAYQEVGPLKIGEVWAVPIMLRVGLLENLARLARQMRAARQERVKAHEIVRAATEGKGTPNLPDGPSDAFVVGLLHALRDQQEVTADLAERVQTWLQRHGVDPAELLRREHHRQAANQVSIGNAVTSLRLLAALDWAAFFESVSHVERELRSEPTGVYASQTFATRDCYRAAVERFARGSKTDEVAVARLAIEAAADGAGPHEQHLGYYLVGDGRREFGQRIGYRPRWGDSLREGMKRRPTATYLGLMTLFTGLAVAAAVWLAWPGSWPLALLFAALALLPASEAGVALLNFVTCRLLPPRVLPRMNFREGIPAEFATFVVIPGMLTKPQSARALLDRLELHYLANPDPNLHFALLTDFADAPAETKEGDDECLKAAMEGVRTLNAKHAPDGPPRFFVLHRKRLYNPSEGCWMGWERKRGKLHEFNRLIRGATDTTYVHCSADPATLPRTPFVLTLDSDTVLPRDAARVLIGTLAHPLNSPVIGDEGRRVVAGYAILQPRVSFLYKAGWRSLFARLFAYSAGIDPYSAAVSDTYQDLAGRGTFTGKGLYHVDAFEATAGRAFPDNHVLSHDLIESAFARCALVSDLEVFDDFPARYTAFSRREHRWARGDWQLLPWLTTTVPTAHDGRVPNPLPALERWKVIDNLRRSLVPAALVLALALGWLLTPASAWAWSLLGLLVLATPLLLHLIGAALGVPAVGVRQAWVNSRAGLLSTVGQAALSVSLLAHQAWTLLDAIGRTLYRIFVSRRHLLEWETAAATEARLTGSLLEFVRATWSGPLTALALGGLLAWLAPEALPFASPFLLAWLLSPLVAWWVSRPLPQRVPEVGAADRSLLRRLACKTWGFFEAFVADEDHWLPPDNYQEGPVEAVAHRTSPTNVGLLLTSTLAAHDLGYLTLAELADRVERTLETMAGLERYRGHFLNWYDTQTLQPLPPAYVSSVDSGNLAGCLLVLAQGLIEKAKETPAAAAPVAVAGLRDRLGLLREQTKGAAAAEMDAALSLLGGADSGAWDSVLAKLAEDAERWIAGATNADAKRLAAAFARAVSARREEAASAELADRLREMAEVARQFVDEMDFRFLYNTQRQLFAIGYHVPGEALDQAHYDLLASEACLTSFLTVARGDVPRRHWFQLGRLFLLAAGLPGLTSWSGTMFEYLMPRLFLPVPEGTLLHTAWRAAVARQIEYGRQTGVAWGISESAYNLTDAVGNYQYQAFGVPGLGLKRGLGRDLVVAPYATVLALSIDPQAAVANVRRHSAEGAEGAHGLYEAIDHTPDRLPVGQKSAVIRSYMAHHQGMSLIAIANLLLGDVMPARLGREPAVRAVDLLLQERVPLDAPVVKSREEDQPNQQAPGAGDAVSRRLTSPSPREPRPHLLSNGRYTVMLTSCGGGYSTRDGLDVTRWRADAASERWGQFLYVRDLRTLDLWSATHQPVCKPADYYEAIYSIDKVEFRRRDGDVETHVEVAVSPEADAEVRRVTVINHSDRPREVELTSYAEVVLMPRAADLAHPAFHKLFLETEWLPGPSALLCRRRPRAADQRPVYAVHVLACDEHRCRDVEYETDRERFLGRRGSVAMPAALRQGQQLGGSVGPVLDPIFAIRCRVTVPAAGRAALCFTTGAADSREQAVAIAERFSSHAGAERVFEMAWAHSRVELKHFNLNVREAQLCQRLAGHVLFPPPALRSPASVLAANRQGQPGLWRHGISGDLPIVLLRLPQGADSMELFRRALTAHAYWHAKGFRTDLVVLNEAPTSYHDEVTNELLGLVRSGEDRDRIDRPAGVFIRKADQFSPDDLTLLMAWARVVLTPERGSLEDQVGLTGRTPTLPAAFRPPQQAGGPAQWAAVTPPQGLAFDNGTGGFSPDGAEYVITGTDGPPPMPWVNVISNPGFGFLVSDSGSGYAWSVNSQLNRLTPWSNDPVSDPPGEAVFLRDERTGEVWSPTPLPAGGPTLVRHGAGYSVFESRRGELRHEMTVFVPREDAVKVTLLRLKNEGAAPLRLSVTYYVEWVLGTQRELTAQHVVTENDGGVILATNVANSVAPSAVAFAAVTPRPRAWTADRVEFLGRNGLLSAPAGLARVALSGRAGAGLDPCAALQTPIEIAPGGTAEVVCLLGVAPDADGVRRWAGHYGDAARAAVALEEAKRRWDDLLGAVRVRTPDPALDLLLNRWLLYQVTSSRLWGRTGFYQSGGAYGFRDQLQDVMALTHAAPALTREHLLRAASRQFREGDVQHWWHPPAGHGVRTRFSDDFLWLVLVACHYAEATGDAAVFDEFVSFLDAPPLQPDQEEVYEKPRVSWESATLYQHCLRALEHGWKLGAHGLPLMGTGDWNDGMNKVGAGGKGESVWVAWFQIVCLERFARVAESRGDADRAKLCRERAAQLRRAAEDHAWDGHWYLRAYFDDGTPLGSRRNDECRIDSLSQSWAVFARADRRRAAEAVEAAEGHLVREADRLVLLFDPPFDSGKLEPGYVKGYVPGTRENGGQYTHAAVWLTQALARLGRGNQAGDLLDLLMPVRHAETPAGVARYKAEPYAVAADVYGRPPHVGRGGWSWYTGAAGWLYQVALGDVLGVRRRGDRLVLDPRVPAGWGRFEVTYRYGDATYEITVENPQRVESGVVSVTLDGAAIEGREILLGREGRHTIAVRMG